MKTGRAAALYLQLRTCSVCCVLVKAMFGFVKLPKGKFQRTLTLCTMHLGRTRSQVPQQALGWRHMLQTAWLLQGGPEDLWCISFDAFFSNPNWQDPANAEPAQPTSLSLLPTQQLWLTLSFARKDESGDLEHAMIISFSLPCIAQLAPNVYTGSIRAVKL